MSPLSRKWYVARFRTLIQLFDHFRQAYISTDPVEASHHCIFSTAALRAVLSIPIRDGNILYILESPSFAYPPLGHTVAHSLLPSDDGKLGNIPTVKDWEVLWVNWDLITLKMIPSSMLHQKPIDLRHKCLFYIGHIPTQVKIIYRLYIANTFLH